MKAKPEAKAGRNESAGTRRSFLRGAGAAGAAGAAVVASKGTALAPARPAELARQRAVAAGGAALNAQQRAPHALLERCAGAQVQRQLEPQPPTAQVVLQLRGGSAQHRVARVHRPGIGAGQPRRQMALAVEPQSGQALPTGGQMHQAQRRGDTGPHARREMGGRHVGSCAATGRVLDEKCPGPIWVKGSQLSIR